ncbi:MAG: metalloprotease PmbA [Gammaproteobacteria bacterium]|nr:metalloprotease PmbA [Gammaproteobacteria bacterium]
MAPVLDRALTLARAAGASQAECGLSVSRGLSVNVRKGEVESVEFHRDRDFSVTVYFGTRSGSAGTGDLSDQGVAEAVAAACSIARMSQDDPCNGLADADRMATAFPDLDLEHPWDLSPDDAIERARACEAAAFAVDRRITQSEGAGLSTSAGIELYANTHGFVGERRASRHSLSCAAIAVDGDEMQRDDWWTSARHPDELESVEAVGRKAGERAVARLGARKLSTRTAPVLFVPDLARGLFGHFISAVSGGALYRKASFLLDKLGQPVFSSIVRAEQKPFIPRGAASAAFDNEGVATAERVLVDGGVLNGYLLGSYSARKLGMRSTGNAGGVFNLAIAPGPLGYEQLLREMGTGLVVTELMGQGLNLVTGDYSRGAAGFWVENGVLAYPVHEVTIAGNLADMFKAIRAVGSDVDVRTGVRCGSVLIEAMTIAGH